MPPSLRSPAHTLLIRRLRQLRKVAGLRQVQVAERLGVPQSYIAKVEGGERRLDLVEFVRLMRVIGADPFQLVEDIVHAVAAESPAGPAIADDIPKM